MVTAWKCLLKSNTVKDNILILCGTNNINKDSTFDIAEFLIDIDKQFQKRSFKGKSPLAYFLQMMVCLSAELSQVTFDFIDQNYGWTRENLYFKDNVN